MPTINAELVQAAINGSFVWPLYYRTNGRDIALYADNMATEGVEEGGSASYWRLGELQRVRGEMTEHEDVDRWRIERFAALMPDDPDWYFHYVIVHPQKGSRSYDAQSTAFLFGPFEREAGAKEWYRRAKKFFTPKSYGSSANLKKQTQRLLSDLDLDHDTWVYTQDEWRKRGEPYGNDAVLSIASEGGLYRLINGGPPRDELGRAAWQAEIDTFNAWLERYRLYYEMGFAWSFHFYPLDAQGNPSSRKRTATTATRRRR